MKVINFRDILVLRIRHKTAIMDFNAYFFVQTCLNWLFTEESYVHYTNFCRSFTKSLLYIPSYSMWGRF